MNTAEPTRTTNPLHFNDLDPSRFEDLCLDLLHGHRDWSDIRHYGRAGSDGGIDILAIEPGELNRERHWFVQCRRYKKASAATLKTAVDDVLAEAQDPPDVLLIAVACDVSRTAHQEFERYSKSKGVSRPLLWTRSVLEAKLYIDRRDLLAKYFDVSDSPGTPSPADRVKQKLGLKERLIDGLIRPVNYEITRTRPFERFKSSSAIIHSIADTSYPDADISGDGISGWFRLEFFDLYHNGIEFITGIQYVVMTSDDSWAPVEYDYEPPSTALVKLKTWHIGCIPYRNIVEIDLLGDEFYPVPHLYCQFADGSEPYEEFRYRLLANDSYPFQLPPETRRPFEQLVA